ncbi:MAG: alpha/beta fold hydrolase [Planctomycetes bacterium]|nr:alpha/beta fold hydrolase [Planctomycetota bacterium]
MRVVLLALIPVFCLSARLGASEDDPHEESRSATQKPAQGAPHKAGEIVLEPASVSLSANEKVDYEAGVLYVPENRADPKSRIIGVGFARFKAPKPTGAPPCFHLPGGPGNSFLMMLKNVMHHMDRYRTVGDVVLVDQRGFSERGDVLKYSYKTADEPLDQPGSLARSSAAFVEMSKNAVADCSKKGIDLRGYTVKECVEDVNDLRKALGYEKITLVGTSFGSQWSFATMRLHPEIVARALLSGVEPLNFGYDMPSQVYTAMQRYFKEAEQDKTLAPYMPPGGLDAAVKEIARRFDKGPLKVEVKDSKSGQTSTVVLGKEDFQRDLLHKASDGPAFILSLYHEHYAAWALAVAGRRRSRSMEQKLVGPAIDTSLGVTPEREKQLRTDPATEFLGQWNWDAYIASAEIWPSPDVGNDFRIPVETSVPVVFAQGDWDTQTPVENTLSISKSFSKSRVLIAERGGHGVLEPVAQNYPKEWGAIVEFLRTGELPNLPERVKLPAPKFAAPDFPAPAAK